VILQGPDLDEASATSDEESMEIDEMSDSSDDMSSDYSRYSVYSVLVLCLLFFIFLCHPVLLCCSLVFSSLLFSLLFSSDKERRGTSDKERRGTLGNVLKTAAVCIPEPVMKAMKLKKPTGKKHKGKSKHRVGDVKVNEKLPNAKKAKELLEKVKKHIDPILRKHGFNVLKLQEDSNTKLLGWCRSACNKSNRTANIIAIRLRQGIGSSKFRDFSGIMGTMLHEITHINIGGHGKDFLRLENKYRQEYGKPPTAEYRKMFGK